MNFLRYALLLVVSFLISGCLTALPKSLATETQIGTLSMNAALVPDGASQNKIVSLMGQPTVSFKSPNNRFEYLHYCLYGFARDEDYGFWLIDGVLRARMEGIPDDVNTLHGYKQDGLVYEDKTVWDCYSSLSIDWSTAPISRKVYKTYNIDRLTIKVTYPQFNLCYSGREVEIKLKGEINADSSFALNRLLYEYPACRNEAGVIIKPVTIALDSPGGYLVHGYKLGETIRKHEANTVIKNGYTCASSCALGFLGGVERHIEYNGEIIFHAPYIRTSTGIVCARDDEITLGLLKYFDSLYEPDEAERLFNRTMSYCDSNNGWVINGNDAALLYGISTH